jgi:hypothetical protein
MPLTDVYVCEEFFLLSVCCNNVFLDVTNYGLITRIIPMAVDLPIPNLNYAEEEG